MDKDKMDYIVIYPEDFKYWIVWKDLCDFLQIDNSNEGVRIYFNKDQIETIEER